MNVGTLDDHGFQKKSIFSPRAFPIVRKSHSSPVPPPPRLAPTKKEKQQVHGSTSTCCCLGMGLTHSQSSFEEAKLANNGRGKTEVRATQQARYMDQRLQEYVSPRLSSPAHNLTVVTAQAKINGWYIEPHEIELHEKVGSGSTADIYRGSWKGMDVAVKCINPNFFLSNENSVTFFTQEVETLSRQRHPFVLRLVGACLDPPEHGWLVTEMLSSTLKDWLHGSGSSRRQTERTSPLPPLEDRLAKALEIAQAMHYLHDQRPKLVHRDLKPSNIFLDDAMHVRVADFGHARFLWDDEKAQTGETGTYVYMAPEVIRCEPYNEKCDVYSYAIILNELVTGKHPYIETDYGPTEIALAVGEGKLRPALAEDDDQLEDLNDIIRCSWKEDYSIRPSFATITCTLRKIIQERFITEC